jgi:hypothetical protein
MTVAAENLIIALALLAVSCEQAIIEDSFTTIILR